MRWQKNELALTAIVLHCAKARLLFAQQRLSAFVHAFGTRRCVLLDPQPRAPMDDRCIGQTVSCAIHAAEPEKLQRPLFEANKIEIPVTVHGSAIYLRFSVQVFNKPESYRALLDAVHQLKTQGIRKGAYLRVSQEG